MTVDLSPWGKPIFQEHTILIRPAAAAPQVSSISISPFLTNADFLDFASIEAEAFQELAISKVLFPQSADPIDSTDNVKKKRAEIRAANLVETSITDSSARFVKAFTPGTHHMVGGAQWNFYLEPANPPKREHVEWPPGANLALGERHLDELYKPRHSYMRGKSYIYMHILTVLPEHQRKGIDRRLLEWVLKQADELGVECWIDATPAGLGLYEKLGWKKVNATRIDLGPYGDESGTVHSDVQLIRPPQPREVVERVNEE